MPGYHDGWSPVPFSTRLPGPFSRTRTQPTTAATEPGPDEGPATTADAPQDRGTGRRRALGIVAGTTALVLAGTGIAVAQAHKTVALDVDGTVRSVGTFAGSVEELLEAEGVTVGDRDTVSAIGPLAEGQEVVVRHAHQITVTDGEDESTVWTTALTADEALDTLAARDADVALVASRSGSRADLALELTPRGDVSVLVDGGDVSVDAAGRTLAEALTAAGITLNELDRVQVRQSAAGDVEVVVTRVVTEHQIRMEPVPFGTTEQKDPDAYVGTETVVTKGVDGNRTIRERVTTVDGKVVTRKLVSDRVTTAPVNEVVKVGTKTRSVSSGSGKPGPITAGGDADSLNWAALARCESGGSPTIVSSNGLYHGLYQFSVGTWRSVGGAGLPSDAPAAEQTARAKMLYNRSGAGPWPHCGRLLFS